MEQSSPGEPAPGESGSPSSTGSPVTPSGQETDSKTETPAPEYRGVGIMWGAVALVIGLVLLVIVALQNIQDVELQLLWFETEAPLVLIVLVAVAIAVVLEEVIGFIWRHRRRVRLKEREELQRLRKRS